MLIGLLGPLEIDDEPPALSPRDRVVLSALALGRSQTTSAELLAEALWPERQPPPSWPKVVQGCVSRLRKAFGGDTIETNPTGYRLRRERFRLDTEEFESSVQRARDAIEEGLPERAVAALDRALALWRGRPYPDLEEWSRGALEAGRLHELRLTAEEERLAALLAARRASEVAAEGTVLVGQEPWRERRWALLALAQYRCDRQADALATIRRARGALGSQLGLDPGSELAELERAILTQDPSLVTAAEASVTSSQCPWRGLASLEPGDADVFFGREDEVVACLERLDRSPLLALVGPSGSGKSSLMKAGVVPALAASGRRSVVVLPGTDPATALAVALARSGSGVDPVLCVDQFEEVFAARLSRAELSTVLRGLAEYAVGRAPVVLTVRSDHLAHLAAEPHLASLVEQGVHLVGPLGGEALRSVIEGPAATAGLHLEHGLVDLLMRDAEDQPGALPLLSHALSETWARREGALLTVEGYHASGDIGGAVAASAERLCQALSESELDQLRWLMLRMGALSEGGEPIRTPVTRQVVEGDDRRTRVAELLVRARLVTSTEGSYELAHEALVRAWPRLRGWLDEDRAGQRVWRHLATAATEWDVMGRPDTELYSGVRLEAAREWLAAPTAEPTPLERAFLDASVARAEADRRELEQQARRDRRQNRRLRGLLAGVGALLVVALVAGLLAVDGARSARRGQDLARQAEADARHESLVSTALGLRASDRDTAALLAVEAYREQPDALGESALLGTFTGSPGFLGHGQVPYDFVQGAPVPGTSRAVIAEGSAMRVVDMDSHELGPLFPNPIPDTRAYSVIRVSEDGGRVAQLVFDPGQLSECGTYERLQNDDGRGCTLLTVWDLDTRRIVMGPLATPFSGGDLALDPTGRTAAVVGGFDGDLATYDVDTGRLLGTLAGPPRPEDAYNVRDTGAAVFRDMGRLLVGSLGGSIREVSARSLRVLRTFSTPDLTSHNFLALASPGLLVGVGDRGLVAVNLDTGKRRWLVPLDQENAEWPCPTFAVSTRSQEIFCGDQLGQIDVRSLADGRRTGEHRDMQHGEVGDLAVNGDELIAFGRGYSRWRLDGTGPTSRMLARGAVSTAGYDSSGRFVEVVRRGSWDLHRVLDSTTGEVVLRWPREADVYWVAPHTLLFNDYEDGRLTLVDPMTGDRTELSQLDGTRVLSASPGADASSAWLATADEENRNAVLEEIRLPAGAPTGRRISLRAPTARVDLTHDGSRLFTAYWVGGQWLDRSNEAGNEAVVVDLDSGRRTRVGGGVFANGAMSGDGRIVGGDYLGGLTEYSTELEPVQSLPGSFGTSSLVFSADGSRLLATSDGGWAQLYDVGTWTLLGRLASDAATGWIREGWLRPDGKALTINTPAGLVEWDLDPEALVDAACRAAGRNLTPTEWASYVPGRRYRATCPDYEATG